MTDTIPIPIWLFLVGLVLVALREYFAAQRDTAMRALMQMYFDRTDCVDVEERRAATPEREEGRK